VIFDDLVLFPKTTVDELSCVKVRDEEMWTDSVCTAHSAPLMLHLLLGEAEADPATLQLHGAKLSSFQHQVHTTAE